MAVVSQRNHHFIGLTYCDSQLLDVFPHFPHLFPRFGAQLLDVFPHFPHLFPRFGAQLLDVFPHFPHLFPRFGAQLLNVITCFDAQLLNVITCFDAQLLNVIPQLADVFVLGVDALEQLAQTEQSPEQDYQHGYPDARQGYPYSGYGDYDGNGIGVHDKYPNLADSTEALRCRCIMSPGVTVAPKWKPDVISAPFPA